MPKYIVQLTQEEREELLQLVAQPKVAAQKRKRAQILLMTDISECGPGLIDQQIMASVDVTTRTINNVRKQCVHEGPQAAVARKPQCRPSRQRKIDGEAEAKLVTLCCGTAPSGHARWTLRLLADEMIRLEIVDTISHESIRQTLKKRLKALEEEHVVHCSRGQRSVCLSNGGGFGCVSSTV